MNHSFTRILLVLAATAASLGATAHGGEKDLPPLHAAVAAGDLDTCRQLLANQPDINAPSEQGEDDSAAQGMGDTPLMLAAQGGYLDICRLLLEAGAAPDATTLYECTTPLFLAAQEGHTEICKLLLSAGADANARTRTASTPLMAAAQNGHLDTCRLLISGGADVKEVDRQGNTALHYALNGKLNDSFSDATCTALVTLLLEHGASANISNDEEITPIDQAADLSDNVILQQLLDSL